MRYFVGIVPPTSVIKDIDSFQAKWGYKSSSPPHITVKAQSGLASNKRWIAKIEKVCNDFPEFYVKLGAPATFGNEVLFLSVLTKEIITMHLRLVDAISPTVEEQKRYYEVTDFIPHLTLVQRPEVNEDTNFEEMKKEADKLFSSFKPFKVSKLTIFKQENNESYEPFLDLPLRHQNQ